MRGEYEMRARVACVRSAHATSTEQNDPKIIPESIQGTALAALLARNHYPTVLWDRNRARVAVINTQHENPRYLPGIVLPDSLQASHDLPGTVTGRKR